MITDRQTNKVYLTRGLYNYPVLMMSLTDELQRCGVAMDFLPVVNSKEHIWARDYMPIQIDEQTFLLYQYNPDYLKDDQQYIPDYKEICRQLNLKTIETDIILDGGNVIKCGDKVILTDKIFCENPTYTKEELIAELERLLQAKLVIIPWDRYEDFGHADGMVRYIGRNRVLITCYKDFDKSLRRRLIKALEPYFTIEELSFGDRKFEHKWAYINFLQVGRNLFIPSFDVPEDHKMLRQFEAIFPDCSCRLIKGCSQLVADEGVLNCSSWNILESEGPRLSDTQTVLNMIMNEKTLIGVLNDFSGADGNTVQDRLDSLRLKFYDIAKQIILGGYIKVNNRRIYICDVEFYYHEENGLVQDPQMYHTSFKTGDDSLPYIDLGKFFTHLGLDVTFENPNGQYRASMLLRSYYIVDDGKCPYGDKNNAPDTRYSYLYTALLADMSIFSGINIQWVDEPANAFGRDIIVSPRKNIDPVESDPVGYQRLWRFKLGPLPR